jgi:hypothetical protein
VEGRLRFVAYSEDQSWAPESAVHLTLASVLHLDDSVKAEGKKNQPLTGHVWENLPSADGKILPGAKQFGGLAGIPAGRTRILVQRLGTTVRVGSAAGLAIPYVGMDAR